MYNLFRYDTICIQFTEEILVFLSIFVCRSIAEDVYLTINTPNLVWSSGDWVPHTPTINDTAFIILNDVPGIYTLSSTVPVIAKGIVISARNANFRATFEVGEVNFLNISSMFNFHFVCYIFWFFFLLFVCW